MTADKVYRSYYDLQVGGRLEQGAFYNAEYVMQTGKATTTGFRFKGQPIDETKISGSALTFEGGFDFIHPRYKRMILAFVFMQGSGDDPLSSDEDERFNVNFGRRFDGLERVGYGDFFAATPYGFFNEDKAVIGVPVGQNTIQTFPYNTLFSGIRMYGFRGSINPWEPFIAGLEFYLYTAREAPQSVAGSPLTIQDKGLGRELVITASYLYAKRINFALRYGKFFASSNLNDVGSTRIILEASGRF